MENNSKYKQDFINEVFAYLVNYTFLDIELNEVFNLNNKEKEILKKVEKQYEKIRLYNDAKKEYLNKLDINLILSLVNNFLIEMFPTMKNEILDLDKLLSFRGDEIVDSGLFYFLLDDEVVIKEIVINDNLNASSIPIIIHEKTHGLAFKHVNTKDLFISGLELLPIFIQKIALYELEKATDYPISVTDTIIRCNDCKNCINYLNLADHLRKHPTEQMDYYVSQYFRIRSTDYLLSDIYSLVLMNSYVQDRNEMIESLNKLFSNRITITEFLNRYNINLQNKCVIPSVKENLEKCKRKIIIS